MPFGSLWLPVLVSTVVTWIASAIAWMALPHHRPDWRSMPDEEAMRAALSAQALAPGQYRIPYCASAKDMNSEDMTRKLAEGPVASVYMTRPGPLGMGRRMLQQVTYLFVTAFCIAYVLRLTLPAGESYFRVFRVASAVAIPAHCLGLFPAAIWFGKSWRATWMECLDGIAYGLLTGAVFSWLWPWA